MGRVVGEVDLEAGDFTGMLIEGLLQPSESFVFIAHADVRQRELPAGSVFERRLAS